VLSLRSFHLFFILLASVGADLFGIWAVWRHLQHPDPGLLVLGLVCIVGGLGLIVYAVHFVRVWGQQP